MHIIAEMTEQPLCLLMYLTVAQSRNMQTMAIFAMMKTSLVTQSQFCQFFPLSFDHLLDLVNDVILCLISCVNLFLSCYLSLMSGSVPCICLILECKI